MDKLQPQTVYVPVVQPENGDKMQDYVKDGFVVAKKVTGVYPLTGKEIRELVDEAMLAAVSCDPSGQRADCVNQFLKQKGIEI